MPLLPYFLTKALVGLLLPCYQAYECLCCCSSFSAAKQLVLLAGQCTCVMLPPAICKRRCRASSTGKEEKPDGGQLVDIHVHMVFSVLDCCEVELEFCNNKTGCSFAIIISVVCCNSNAVALRTARNWQGL